MPTAYLYELDRNRESHFVMTVNVDLVTYEALQKNYKTSWCADNGMGPEFYLRDRKVIETSPAERASLQRDHDAMQRSGRMPSAFSAIATSLKHGRK